MADPMSDVPSHSTRIERRLRTLRRCVRALVRATSEDALFREVCQAAVEEGGHQFAWVGVPGPAPECLVVPVATAGNGGDYLARTTIRWRDDAEGRGPVGTAMRLRQPVWTDRISSDPAMAPWRDHAQRHGFRSAIAVPLTVEGDVLGTVTVYSSSEGAFDADEVSLLTDLAADVAYGIGVLRAQRAHDRARADLEAAHAALVESETRWKLAIEAAGDGVWDWDARTNRVVFSTGWKTMLGYSDEEIGDSLDEWSTRLHPDDREATMAAIDAHFAGRTPQYENEHRLRCKDGNWKWILDRGRVFSRDADGRPLRVVGTHFDITARRQAEAALRTNRDMLEHVLEHAPIGFAVNRISTGTLIFISQRFLRIYDIEAVPPAQVADFFDAVYADPVFREQMRQRVMADIESGDPARLRWEDVEFVTRTGQHRVVTAENIPVPGHDLMVSTVQDVTARFLATKTLAHRTTELQERNEELERFNMATVDREVRMIELKREINALSARVGEPPRYAVPD